MKIAIFGASSQIAKDLIASFVKNTDYSCDLFVRQIETMQAWLSSIAESRCELYTYESFSKENVYDVVINFVGVGDPARAKEMGASIFDVTHYYDSLALDYIKQHKSCRYIFLSSGAVYGGSFEKPITNESTASIDINNLVPSDWYAVAKLHAEARHRAMSDYSIVDLRVFNYFSHAQDMSARFLITDIVRALKNSDVLKTSDLNIFRDFITPTDFYQLIQCVIDCKPINQAIDCYTKEPIDKLTMLADLSDSYGLKYELVEQAGINATGLKTHYYSLNRAAEEAGYVPQFTSMDGIKSEIQKVLH
ncbi:NAD(P)-dependent oxidoreductase [Hydrogenovibrio sp. 3SP14C1]|uniref:NAD-dependent epimerase/dehydratase family protein n=1 Tax=Hydrogenovibrio sp. 3SP14C1 TaxID=3038774 RepID=UPI002416F148|nr:NAD(P)-dependent oxidoreductase [Hydrogenovibrio sp. 3SP14C1]MDG4812252.1 NAD(P)-dependent oxidoreductase [Hydrogenovibrio sp. 3SP14C1]